MDDITNLIQAYMDDQAAIGAAVALLKDGEVIYTRGFGTTAVAEGGIGVTPNTLFTYGSICKNLCAVLIMRLAEKGLLELDAPVADYLPGLRFSDASYGAQVTLRHLLSHTSGLPMGGKYWGPRDPDSLRRFVYEQIPYYQFLSAPGAMHLYSNTVICVAGHVAEAVTGRYYDDLMQDYVFDPLGMDRVTFDPVVAMTYPLALAHERGADGELQVSHKMTYNVSGNPSSFAYGRVVDLANLAQMYLNEGQLGEGSFLSAGSVAEMGRAYGRAYIESAALSWSHVNEGYGLGFYVGNYKGHCTARHGGMNLSFNCFFDLFPDDRAGVILLTNYCEDSKLIKMVMDLYDYVLDLPQEGFVYLPKPGPSDTLLLHEQLQRYAGTYLNVETAVLATFHLQDDELWLTWSDELKPLVPISSNQFYVDYSETSRLPVAFVPDADGHIDYVMMGGSPYHPHELDTPFRPDTTLWEPLAGMYKDPSNSNYNDILTVRVEDEVLFVAEGENKVACQAVSNRCFLSEMGLFEFADSPVAEAKILVWGKAVRFYPLDEERYRKSKAIEYLIDIPTIPQQVK